MKTKLKLSGSIVFATLIIIGLSVFSCKKDSSSTNDGKTDPSTIASTALVAYFPFEGNGKDTISGMTPSTIKRVTYATGKRGLAYVAGDSSYLQYNLLTASPLKTLTAFTVAMWFYGPPAYNGVAPVPGILQIDGGSDPNWGNMVLTQDRVNTPADTLNMKIVFYKSTANWSTQFQNFHNPAIIMNHWIHLIISYDSNTSLLTAYTNGAKSFVDSCWADGENIHPRPVLGALSFSNATQLAIGGWLKRITGASTDDWMGYFTGKLDELRIYNRGLTATEAKALFDAEVTQLNAK